MKSEINLLPSLLSADAGCFLDEIKTVDMPEIDYLHFDVMDGQFVPNISFGPGILKALSRKSRFSFDAHLMITQPENYISDFANAGAKIITVHQEACHHAHRVIQQIKDCGAKAGISLNPGTPLESIKWLLPELDLVLIMSVNPGFGGQEFIPEMLLKISELAEIKKSRKLNFIIEVDGGIDANTAGAAAAAGAEYLVAGNAIFGEKDRKLAIRNILNRVSQK